MRALALLLVLLAQHRSGHEPAFESDPVPVRASEAIRVIPAPVTAAPAAEPVPTQVPTVPWFWLALGATLLVVGLVSRRDRVAKTAMPGRRVTAGDLVRAPLDPARQLTGNPHLDACAGPCRPAYSLVIEDGNDRRAADGDALPVPLEKRSLTRCHTEYIDTVRAVVKQQMGGRTDIQCVAYPQAPLVSRHRAWIAAKSWETAHAELRSTGASEGMALKRLLATFKANGGTWLAWAAERQRVELPEAPKPIVAIVPAVAA